MKFRTATGNTISSQSMPPRNPFQPQPIGRKRSFEDQNENGFENGNLIQNPFKRQNEADFEGDNVGDQANED